MPRVGEEIVPESDIHEEPPQAIPQPSPLPLPQPSPVSESTVNQVAVSDLPGSTPVFSTVVFNPPEPAQLEPVQPVGVQIEPLQSVDVQIEPVQLEPVQPVEVSVAHEAEMRPMTVTFQGSENGVAVVPAVTPAAPVVPAVTSAAPVVPAVTPAAPVVATPAMESGGLPTPSAAPAASEVKPEPIPKPMLRSNSTHTSKPFVITPLPNAVSHTPQRNSSGLSSNYSHGYSAIPTMKSISQQRLLPRAPLNTTPTMKSTRSIRNSQKTENSSHTPLVSPVEVRPAEKAPQPMEVRPAEKAPQPVQEVQSVQAAQPVQVMPSVTPMTTSTCVVIDDADFSLTNEMADSMSHTPLVLPVPVMGESEPAVVIPEANAVGVMDDQNRDDFGKASGVEFEGIQQLPTVPSGLPTIINVDAMENE